VYTGREHIETRASQKKKLSMMNPMLLFTPCRIPNVNRDAVREKYVTIFSVSDDAFPELSR
jgi:hypothetical protein